MDFVDLTATDDEEDPKVEDQPSMEPDEPLGIDICPDIVDMEEDADDDQDVEITQVKRASNPKPSSAKTTRKVTNPSNQAPRIQQRQNNSYVGDNHYTQSIQRAKRKRVESVASPIKERSPSNKSGKRPAKANGTGRSPKIRKEQPQAQTRRSRSPKKSTQRHPHQGLHVPNNQQRENQPRKTQRNNQTRKTPGQQFAGQHHKNPVSQKARQQYQQQEEEMPPSRTQLRGGGAWGCVLTVAPAVENTAVDDIGEPTTMQQQKKVMPWDHKGQLNKATHVNTNDPPTKEPRDLDGELHDSPQKSHKNGSSNGDSDIFRSIFPDFDKPVKSKASNSKERRRDSNRNGPGKNKEPAHKRKPRHRATSNSKHKAPKGSNAAASKISKYHVDTKTTTKKGKKKKEESPTCKETFATQTIGSTNGNKKSARDNGPGQGMSEKSGKETLGLDNYVVLFSDDDDDESSDTIQHFVTQDSISTAPQQAPFLPSQRTIQTAADTLRLDAELAVNGNDYTQEASCQMQRIEGPQATTTNQSPVVETVQEEETVVGTSYMSPARKLNAKSNNMPDTPEQQLESPVGVNICVGVDEMEESPSGRKVSVSEETAEASGEVEPESPVGVDICIDVDEMNEFHRGRKASVSVVETGASMATIANPGQECVTKPPSNKPSFRPNKPAPGKKHALEEGSPTNEEEEQGQSAAASEAELSPCRNFIVIDDDENSEEEYCCITDVKPASKPIHELNGKSDAATKLPTDGKKAQAASTQGQYTFFKTEEAAAELQDRLFREAADRMKKRVQEDPTFYQPAPVDQSRALDVPLPDVYKHYPDHWQWRDPYARLGLPHRSSASLVKTHYRKLALVYHPDKLKVGDSTERFHAITAAYRKLTAA